MDLIITDFQEQVNQIKEKVSRTSLYIGRVPEKTKTEFIELAKSEFTEDYGMCLKWLLDFRNGLLSNPNQILLDNLELCADKIAKLEIRLNEMANKKPDEKKIKLLSGRELNRRNENEQTKSVAR